MTTAAPRIPVDPGDLLVATILDPLARPTRCVAGFRIPPPGSKASRGVASSQCEDVGQVME